MHPAPRLRFPVRGGQTRPDRAEKALRPRRSRLVPTLGLALAGSTIWSGATSYYIVFHDEMLGRFFGQVRAVQLAYEQRLGALNHQVERSTSERVRNHQDFETRLSALAERQAVIETRQGLLADLGAPEPETTGSISPIGPAVTGPNAAPARAQTRMPSPAPATSDAAGTFDLRMHGDDRVEAPEHRLGRGLAALEARLDRLTERQSRIIEGIAARTGRSADRYRSVIVQAGLDPDRFEGPERAIGGPLVPLSGDAFDLALAETRRASGDAQRLRRTVDGLPLRRPLAEQTVTTSSFGTRLDPFTRGLALHTGIDMRADHGTAARATAPGRITAAEYGGGYGNMVEIDHGHGLVTRYAHLAAYAVVPGQKVEAGAVVGRVGSTGRSTGNHLHYEVRIDGQPVDPERFLRAGASLTGEVADPGPGATSGDGLSTESWLAWSKAQLQKLTRAR